MLDADAAGEADDGRMGARADTPDMQVGDPGITLRLDLLANLRLQVGIGAVEKDGGSIAQQVPGPNPEA